MRRDENRLTSGINLRTIALAGTLLLAASQTAMARNDHFSFRDFRNQNSELSRHEARQLFQEQRQVRAGDAEPRNPGPVINTNTLIPTTSNAGLDTVQQVDHVRHRSAQLSSTGNLRLKNGIDIDLSSADKNIVLGKNLFADGATVQINSGGETKTVGAGSVVSAAEYVAVKQVLGGSGQQIAIGSSGKATGGSVDLESIASDRNALRASELVIPENVTTSGDFGRNAEFRLLGNLNNYGTVNAYNSDGTKHGGAIRAVDINNYKGATIHSDVDLTLDASGVLTNAGTIESTGSLTLSAQNGIANKGSISAATDVTLDSAAALYVNNTKGTISAGNNINVRSASFDGAFDTYVAGGDLLANQINVNAGQGTANLYVNSLTGLVNEKGYAAHVAASTGSLNIGDICLAGDPTIYNLDGDIAITGNIDVAERLVLVATGNITASDNVTIHAGDNTRGYGIEMIAGASFVLYGGGGGAGAFASVTNIPPLNPVSGVDLNGKKSKTGGGILLGNNVTITAQSSDLSGNSNGDVVALLAFAGKGQGAGTVDMSGTTIKTGGSGTGFNGDLYVLAASTKGDVIKTGVVDTTGGSAQGGTDHNGVVGMYTVDIVPSQKGQHVIYDATGLRISSAFLTGEELNKSGNIIINDTAAPVDIKAFGFMDIDGGGNVSLNGQISGTSVDLISNGSVTNGTNGALTATAFSVFLIAPNIGSQANPINVLDAPEVSSFGGKGTSNFVKIGGSGDCLIAGTSNGTIVFDAPGRNIGTTFVPFGPTLTASTITINAEKLLTIDSIDCDTLNLNVNSGSITDNNFTNPILANKLFVTNTTGNIGVNAGPFAGPFHLQAKTTEASFQAGGYIIVDAAGKTQFDQLSSTGGKVVVNAQDAVTFSQPVTAGGGIVSIFGASSITLGSVTATDGITLNASGSKGSIAINKDAVLSTTNATPTFGDILITVKPDSATVIPTPANVTTSATGTGTIVFTGAGVKAKAPTNTLSAPGSANISVNNGLKQASITFGGNVQITAN